MNEERRALARRLYMWYHIFSTWNLFFMGGTMWRVAAEVVFWFHIAWIVALMTGIAICWMPRFARVRWLVAFGLGITWLGQLLWRGCPLTKLELFLLAKHDPHAVFRGSFIGHYVHACLGIAVKAWYIDVAFYIMMALLVLAFLSGRKKNKQYA